MSNDNIYNVADIAEYYEMALQSAARDLEFVLDTYGPENAENEEMMNKFLRMLVNHWREFKAPGRRED